EKAAEVQEKKNQAETAQQASASASTADGRKPPFWFLSAANPANLAFIMQTHSIEDLTIILSYAPGDLASRLAEELYPRSVEALAALPTVKLVPEDRVRQLEAELQTALDYVVGGEDKTLNILNNLDEAVQEKALTAFAGIDPALSKKLNASVVKLSDVQNLEQVQAQALTRRLPIRVLASALKTTTYVDAFVSKLASGMQERFRQELELTRVMPAAAYKADRAQVMAAIRQMIAEGFLTLSKTGAPAAAAARKPLPQLPGAAPAPAPAKPLKTGAAIPAPGQPAVARPPSPAAPVKSPFSPAAPAPKPAVSVPGQAPSPKPAVSTPAPAPLPKPAVSVPPPGPAPKP
ncbi:MAG: hypothetical protein COT18_12750, partial [Elusimicrobia bacterium CG08_land_8_20_14_0_20_59_10]